MVDTAHGGATARAVARREAVFTPLYKQIKGLLLQDLDRGSWKPGELIPSEIELAARFQVSQGTVRKAIDELAAENLLLRRQGKGTFVATHHEPKVQFRFLRIMPDEGEPVAAQSRFLECRRQRATADVARSLDLKAGDGVVYVRRLLSFKGAAIIVDDLWLPGGLFKGLTAERLAEYHGPLYGLFETEFGTRMIRAEERLRACRAEPEIAKLLKVASDAPILLVERVSFTYGERPVELRRGYCLTEHHHYHNTLS
ncbi:MAG TPA: GntR family transcriptional regulator [Burkholderiaceae bacterium]|nr:GntR family transcriptional regulator [Burkholderiaceae bacterium]